MHEYYWENYTEMDQYGYEDYDNQAGTAATGECQRRAVASVANVSAKCWILLSFGRVDFLYEGDEEPEAFYIGIANLSEKAGQPTAGI